MNSLLHRRLVVLERVPAVLRTEYRVYATMADADADATPPRPDGRVLAIITGVARAASTP
jgi:hypothetical protein